MGEEAQEASDGDDWDLDFRISDAGACWLSQVFHVCFFFLKKIVFRWCLTKLLTQRLSDLDVNLSLSLSLSSYLCLWSEKKSPRESSLGYETPDDGVDSRVSFLRKTHTSRSL